MPTRIHDEFTDLPISGQLKAYYRRIRDRKCVTCGRVLYSGDKLRCIRCKNVRAATRMDNKKKGKKEGAK